MLKNSLIFLMQAIVVSAITVYLGAEAFLHYKEKFEPKIEIPACPTLRQDEGELFFDCINNVIFIRTTAGGISQYRNKNHDKKIYCSDNVIEIGEGGF